MGRPVKDMYFGNRDAGNIGGKSVTAVALGTAGSNYSQGLTATVAVPAIGAGVRATVSVSVTPATGAIASYTVTNPTNNSGYVSTSPPAITLVQPAAATSTYISGTTTTTLTVGPNSGQTNTIYTGMVVTGGGANGYSSGSKVSSLVVGPTNTVITLDVGDALAITPVGVLTFTDTGSAGAAGAVTLTATAETNQTYSPAIALTAITVGSTPRANSDIVKQVGSRRYKVKNQDGTAICKLVAATPTIVGQASLIATDSAAGTYYVTKLTEHRALLTSITGTQFATGSSAKWTFGTAVVNNSVKIASM